MTELTPTLHRRGQLAAIAWLRWRLFVNALRTSRGVLELISRIVVSFAFAIGGLGGAIGTSIVFGGDPADPFSPIRGLNTASGWTQLKFQLTPKLELNGVFAEDNAFAGDVRGFATNQNNFGEILGRNHGTLANVVFRPRSDLVLSAEFRRLHTSPIYDASSSTNQVNLSLGILF